MKLFSGVSATEVWDKAYECFLEKKQYLVQPSRIGKTLEIMKVVFSVSNSRNRWITHRVPMISPAFAIVEVFWLLDGRDDADFINNWNPVLKKYAGDVEHYYGAYGNRLKYNFGHNQIEKAYNALLHNPSSRQVVLQIWDPEKDLPKFDGIPNSDDIPCNISSIIKIRDNKLEWSQIMRGNDLFRGTPYNFIQFTMLQEIMAGWLNLELGEYLYFTDSLHIYESDLAKFSKREKSILIENGDRILFGKEEFDSFFPKCMKILEKVKETGIKAEDIEELRTSKIIPQEYKNLLSLPLAYLAYKTEQYELVNRAESICSNKLLLKAWTLWKKEVKGV